MRELNRCLEITREIAEINMEIAERRGAAMSPRGQVITGMPRGGGGQGGHLEWYVSKLEDLEDRKKRLVHERRVEWSKALAFFQQNGVLEEHIELMYLRFYGGCKWSKCCSIMQGLFPAQKWNMNKVFRTYRKILKLSK